MYNNITEIKSIHRQNEMDYNITEIRIKRYETPICCSMKEGKHIFNIGINNVELTLPKNVTFKYRYQLVGYNIDEIGVYSAMLVDLSSIADCLEGKKIAKDCKLIIEE